MKYKVLHTADTHLRARQYGHSSRGDDFLKAFQKVVDIAVGEGVDEGHGLHQVGAEPGQHQRSFPERLVHQRHIELLEVAQTTVNET